MGFQILCIGTDGNHFEKWKTDVMFQVQVSHKSYFSLLESLAVIYVKAGIIFAFINPKLL